MDYIFILLCALIVPFTQSFKIQHNMMDNEAEEAFSIDDADYEVVPVRHMLHKRSINELAIQTKINGKDQEIFLNPTEGLLAGTETKIMTATTNAQNNVIYTLITNAMENVYLKFYQNRETSSSISHRINEDGESEFNGIINDDLVIRPLPNHLRKRRDLLKTNSSSFESEAEGFINAGEHIIYKQDFNNNSEFSKAKMSVAKIVDATRVSRRSASGIPKIVYPELMIFVDDIIFKNFNSDVIKAVEYTLSFWNSVDLRYREFETPKIRLNIAGIVLLQGPLPFVNQATYNLPKGMVDKSMLLNEFGRFLLNEETIKAKEDYDVSLFMTGRGILDTKTGNSSVNGVAFFSGVCREGNDGLYISSGVVEDNNGYIGMITAAHELAHILGAKHDEKDIEKIRNNFSMKECHWNEGYIMSYERKTGNQFFFSPCSKIEIAAVLSHDDAACVRNNPAENRNNHPAPRILPGKYMSLNEQCRILGYGEPYPEVRSCLETRCFDKSIVGRYHTYSIPLSEGSPCGDGKYCLGGQCVNEKKNSARNLPKLKNPQPNPQPSLTPKPSYNPKPTLTPKPNNTPKTPGVTETKVCSGGKCTYTYNWVGQNNNGDIHKLLQDLKRRHNINYNRNIGSWRQ